MKIRTIYWLSFLMTFLVLVSCGTRNSNSNQGAGNSSGEIKIDGSSTVYPITEAIAEEFRTDHAGVKVTVGISGTGGGFKKFGRGEIDINDASRPIKDIEENACNENKITYIRIKIAYDGLAVVVSKQNTWLKSVTVANLKKIWEPGAQGIISKWNQVDTGWPATELNLYGPGVASGTYDYFTEVIVGKSGSSRGDYTASEDDNVLVQGVAGDKNALGFFGISYFEENQDKLRLIPVDNGKGPVMPDARTVMSGEYAPLSRPLFIYVTAAATKRAEVVEFVNFFLAQAPHIVKDVGYVPLRKEEYDAELRKFADFLKTGG